MRISPRALIATALVVVALQLFISGDGVPGEAPRAASGPDGHHHHAKPVALAKPASKGSSVRLPDELTGASSGKKQRRRSEDSEILQVDVDDTDAEGAEEEEGEEEEEGAALQGRSALPGSGAAGSDVASWQGQDRALRWRSMLRPDMEFLVTKESLHGQTGTTVKGKPMVVFRFSDHKGSVRELQWESDFMEAAMLPMRDWHFTSGSRSDGMFTRHSSCALVGNSGVLSASKLGAEIDGHDAVIRINYAPTKGFEADVGTKTTYDLINKENCLKLARNEHRWRVPKAAVFLFESHSRVIRSQVYIKLFQRPAVKAGQEKVYVLQPALMTTSRAIYLMIKREVEDEINSVRLAWGVTGELNMTRLHDMSPYMIAAIKRSGPMNAVHGRRFLFNDKPMSGMAALFLAMQMCDKTTMYGFNSFLDKRKQKYHYFDDREGMTNVHSFDLAMEVFRRIGEEYPVTVRQ